jgi:hypothetical protein
MNRLPTVVEHRLQPTAGSSGIAQCDAAGYAVSLSIFLGQPQITTTQRYLHLLPEDLSASHQKVSSLNRLA